MNNRKRIDYGSRINQTSHSLGKLNLREEPQRGKENWFFKINLNILLKGWVFEKTVWGSVFFLIKIDYFQNGLNKESIIVNRHLLLHLTWLRHLLKLHSCLLFISMRQALTR